MILGIDSSLGTSVAVIDEDGVVLAERDSENPLGHAEVVGSLLVDALADTRFGPVGGTGPRPGAIVASVAVGMGPGPFTGLRVGIAAGRAFAGARSLPVVPVVSHDAAALAVYLADPYADPAPFAIVTDARRREYAYSVYTGLDADGLPMRTAGPTLAPRQDIDARLSDAGAIRRDVQAIPAAMVALVAARTVAAGRETVSGEPLYLRAPDVTVRPAVPPT